MSHTVQYVDTLQKEVVENWSKNNGFNAEESIIMHMQSRFNANAICICGVRDEGDHMILDIATEIWDKPREFALFSSGSLMW